MTLERIAGICFCLVVTPAVATGQQRSGTANQGPQGPARSVIERAYAVVPDAEGRLAPVQETVVEEIRTAPNTTQTRRDVFGFAQDRRRRLLETTESLRETQANGDTSVVHNTWAPDLNGRLGLMSRQIEQTRSAAADVRQTDTTLLVPRFNETLRETERTEYTERRINPGVVRHDSTHLVRDVNGRWQPIEARRGEAREIGASERLEEETIERRDMNGKLAVAEKTVTRRSNANGQDVGSPGTELEFAL